MTNTYDENVNWVTQELHGTNNDLVLSKKLNYSVLHLEYDEDNKNTAAFYYGTNRKPTMINLGYSSIRIYYDEYGNTTTNYYDDKGNQIYPYK